MAVSLAVMGPKSIHLFSFCVLMFTKYSDPVSWTGLKVHNSPPHSLFQVLAHPGSPEMSYLQPSIAAGWQGDHRALFLQMCSWVKGLWFCCFRSPVQMFSSGALGFLAVGEDHWFSCTLVVSQLCEVPPLVPLLFIASMLKPYMFPSWLLLILASWVKLLESS